jgi:hypothetical protein
MRAIGSIGEFMQMKMLKTALFLMLGLKAVADMPEVLPVDGAQIGVTESSKTAPVTRLWLGSAKVTNTMMSAALLAWGLVQNMRSKAEWARLNNQKPTWIELFRQSFAKDDLSQKTVQLLKNQAFDADGSIAGQLFVRVVDRTMSQKATQGAHDNRVKAFLENAALWVFQGARLCYTGAAFIFEVRKQRADVRGASHLCWSMGNIIASATLQYMTLQALQSPTNYKIPIFLKQGVEASETIKATLAFIEKFLTNLSLNTPLVPCIAIGDLVVAVARTSLINQAVSAAEAHIAAQRQKGDHWEQTNV